MDAVRNLTPVNLATQRSSPMQPETLAYPSGKWDWPFPTA